MENNDNIGFYMKKISDYLLFHANARLKELDLTFSQMHIIMYLLHRENEFVLQKEIEKHFGLRHPTVIGHLKRMEKKNLIRIDVNPDDRRSNKVTILPKGIELGKKMIEGRKEVDKILTKNLTEKQEKDFKELLNIIYTKTCIEENKTRR